MRPGAVGAKEQLVRAGAPDCLNQIVKLPDGRRVRVNVGIAPNLIDHLLVSFPVVGVAAEVRDDEIYVGILRSKHVDDLGPADDIHQHRHAKPACRVAHLTRRHGIEAVNFDASEIPFVERAANHVPDAPRVAAGVNERKTDQAAGMSSNDLAEFFIGLRVVAVESGNDDRLVDAGKAGAPNIGLERRDRVPGGRHAVAFSSVAMTVDDHMARHSIFLWPVCEVRSLAAAVIYQMLVAIAL